VSRGRLQSQERLKWPAPSHGHRKGGKGKKCAGPGKRGKKTRRRVRVKTLRHLDRKKGKQAGVFIKKGGKDRERKKKKRGTVAERRRVDRKTSTSLGGEFQPG